MRVAILSILLLLFAQATFAANLQPQPAGTMVSMATAAHPPHRTRLPKERTGTVGFVASLVLGPVGYLGVRLFSRDDNTIYMAKRGLGKWMGLVVMSGL